MAIAQSTYTDEIAKGYPGMVANGETSNRISRIVEQSGGIGFGKAVYRSSDQGVDTTEAAGTFLGFTIANYAAPAEQATGAVSDSYPEGSTAGIMTQGVMWVQASAAVAAGAQVYVATDGSINSTDTNVIADGWFFQDTTTASGIVRIARR